MVGVLRCHHLYINSNGIKGHEGGDHQLHLVILHKGRKKASKSYL